MDNSQKQQQIEALFCKIALGVPLNEAEQELLAELRKEERWQQAYEKLVRKEYLWSRIEDFGRYDQKKAFRQFCQRVYRPMLRRRIVYWSAAAAIVLLLGVGGWWRGEVPRSEPAYVQQEVIAPGENKAVLVLANGKTLAMNGNHQHIKTESGIEVEERQGQLSYRSFGKLAAQEAVWHELVTPRGGEFSIVLDDGTRVRLNADSRLRYPVKFEGNVRQVELQGEAYFEVAKNEKVPFVVKCKEVQMRVLGTSFNINSYEDQPKVSTTLISGRLEVGLGMDKVVLMPGQQAEADFESNSLKCREVDIELYTAWINNKFAFYNESLKAITASLARWYDVEFSFQAVQPEDFRLTGKIPRYCSLQEVCVLLKKISGLTFEIQGREVRVK